ncbi:hypothetical protein B0H10DRAFT_1957528 [Mycena sp. CBHHK59/15]|nr:hypothetical protein B0H10DRAFT_1957528 [Mycena sp. CBHHK59/15]
MTLNAGTETQNNDCKKAYEARDLEGRHEKARLRMAVLYSFTVLRMDIDTDGILLQDERKILTDGLYPGKEIPIRVERPALPTTSIQISGMQCVAFEHRQCGDCLSVHLINKCGPQGLEVFLPPRKLTSFVPQGPTLAKQWQHANFSSMMDQNLAVDLM